MGPVLVTLDLAVLHVQGQHGDDQDVLFPDHLPEVVGGVGERPLSGDVVGLHLSHVHQNVAGVYVAALVTQFYTVKIIYKTQDRKNKK